MTIRAKHAHSLSAMALLALSAVLGLSACAGGGESTRAPQTSVPAPRGGEAVSFNWTHEAVRVQGAHDRVRERFGEGVLPGEGVSVGIIDTGIDLGHWAFDRERVTEVNLDRDDATESGFVISHGTSVASVIAAQPGSAPREFEDIGLSGVAPGARLTMFAVADRGPEGPTQDEELGWFGSALAPEAGVDILNISFGTSYDLISDYPDEAALRSRYGRLMDLLAQPGKEEPSLIVFAAGNDNGPCDPALVGAFDDPSRCVADPDISEFYKTPTGLFFAVSPGVDAALQVHGVDLRGHVVSVVATRRDRELASFSNRCGIAAPWCIAAPGVDVPVAYYGPEDPADPYASALASPRRGQELLPGTSFAAPLVAGGLAVLKHRFRGQLGNEALLERLYATADKEGPAAPDEVSGPGLCPAPRRTAGRAPGFRIGDRRRGRPARYLCAGRRGRPSGRTARSYACQAGAAPRKRCTRMGRGSCVAGGGRIRADVRQHRRRSIAGLVLHDGARARRGETRCRIAALSPAGGPGSSACG